VHNPAPLGPSRVVASIAIHSPCDASDKADSRVHRSSSNRFTPPLFPPNVSNTVLAFKSRAVNRGDRNPAPIDPARAFGSMLMLMLMVVPGALAAASTVNTVANPTLGAILTDSDGRTLYRYTKDTVNVSSACYGRCVATPDDEEYRWEQSGEYSGQQMHPPHPRCLMNGVTAVRLTPQLQRSLGGALSDLGG